MVSACEEGEGGEKGGFSLLFVSHFLATGEINFP